MNNNHNFSTGVNYNIKVIPFTGNFLKNCLQFRSQWPKDCNPREIFLKDGYNPKIKFKVSRSDRKC